MQKQKSKSKKPVLVKEQSPRSGRKSSMVVVRSEEKQEPTEMAKLDVKIGANFERHIKKYGEGSDYESFAKRTAQKVTISRHDGWICEKFNIYNIAHLVHIHNTVPEEIDITNPEEIIDSTVNPYELARMWKDVSNDAVNYVDKWSIIAEKFYGMKESDFERWGDKNWNISKKWFFPDAINLDVKVEALSEESGIEIGIEDVIQFVKDYKPGEYMNPRKQLLKKIESKFKEVTGFTIKPYYAEHLIKSCEYLEVSITDEVPF